MAAYNIMSTRDLLLALSIVATTAVALRFWARRIQKCSFQLNDYLILPALACALANVIFYTVRVKYPEITYDIPHIFAFGIQYSLWFSAMTLIRSSIIFLYVHIFPTRWFRVTCYSILIVNIVCFVAMVVGHLLASIMTSAYAGASYYSFQNLLYKTDLLGLIFNLFLDTVVVILPVPPLWRLHMPISKKMMLSGMFGLGIIICTITASRLGALMSNYNSSVGYLYDILLYFEPILSIITACLPVLKPVYNKAHHSIKRIGNKLAIRSFLESGSIPIVMRVSQMWNSISAQRAERDGEHSIVAMEDWRRVQTEIRSSSRAERPEGESLPDSLPNIHVQKDIHIEVTTEDDRIGAQRV